jgi:hypothetical protein
MILTPEQIAGWVSGDQWGRAMPDPEQRDSLIDTLAAYAEIVQKLAEWKPEPYECMCGGLVTPEDEHVHLPDCPYLAACKLRGLDAA